MFTDIKNTILVSNYACQKYVLLFPWKQRANIVERFFIWIAKEETGFYWTKSDSKAESDLKIFIRNEMVLFKSWVVGDESMINSWSLFSWVLDTFVSLHFKFLNRVLWREWIFRAIDWFSTWPVICSISSRKRRCRNIC